MRTIRQRLDIHGEPDRDERQVTVLGEVIANDGEALGMAMAYVDDT
ncbi:hypothetical protein U9R90_06440 [Streptomyces sp. E11-3]